MSDLVGVEEVVDIALVIRLLGGRLVDDPVVVDDELLYRDERRPWEQLCRDSGGARAAIEWRGEGDGR